MNGVEPLRLDAEHAQEIAKAHPQSKIQELLPWNFEPETK